MPVHHFDEQSRAWKAFWRLSVGQLNFQSACDLDTNVVDRAECLRQFGIVGLKFLCSPDTDGQGMELGLVFFNSKRTFLRKSSWISALE